METAIVFCVLSLRIKQGVWEVFAKETLSHEVRSRALKPLRQLLKLRPPSLAASKWEVRFSDHLWLTGKPSKCNAVKFVVLHKSVTLVS